MENILLIGGKFIIASALLMAFYWLVLRRRASYKFNRLYLITLPLISAIMSAMTFEIPVNMPRVEKIEQAITPLTNYSPATVIETETKAPVPATAETSVTQSSANEVTADKKTNSYIVDYFELLTLLIAVISVILLLIGLFYIGRLLYIKSNMKADRTAEGYDVIHSESISTPFSFAKTIFLPAGLEMSREEMIIQHEKAHIAHGHYMEVWFIELMSRVFWFNPIIWLCRSELRNVHEYEADHDVINQGANVLAYQTTLLEMVLNESCPVVNGFNHSFIRQRFIEMKSSTAGTLGRMGKLGMIAWVALLFCSFTFKTLKDYQSGWRLYEWEEPKIFTLHGFIMDSDFTDSCFQIQLSDRYFHFEEDAPVYSAPVINGQFTFQVPLTHVTAGRVRGVSEDAAKQIHELFFVPGTTLDIQINWNECNLPTGNEHTYVSQIKRAIAAVRNETKWQSPHRPVPQGKAWTEVDAEYVDGIKDSGDQLIRDVYLGKDSTVVRFYTNDFDRLFGDVQNYDGTLFYLVDANGKKYAPKGNHSQDKWSIEDWVFGVYRSFEPLPSGTKSFSVETTSRDGKKYFEHASNIHKADKKKPNFNLHITVSPGITDCGYLINLHYGDTWGRINEIRAEIPVDENRQCTFSTYLDSICYGSLQCTFPDGSVCTHIVNFIFVPGETAEVRVKNGTFELTGSKVYQEWHEASENAENAEKYRTTEEFSRVFYSYLKEHKNELGCLLFYVKNRIIPREIMYQPEEIDEYVDGILNATWHQAAPVPNTGPQVSATPSAYNEVPTDSIIPGTCYTRREYENLKGTAIPFEQWHDMFMYFQGMDSVKYENLKGIVNDLSELKMSVHNLSKGKNVRIDRLQRLLVSDPQIAKTIYERYWGEDAIVHVKKEDFSSKSVLVENKRTQVSFYTFNNLTILTYLELTELGDK